MFVQRYFAKNKACAKKKMMTMMMMMTSKNSKNNTHLAAAACLFGGASRSFGTWGRLLRHTHNTFDARFCSISNMIDDNDIILTTTRCISNNINNDNNDMIIIIIIIITTCTCTYIYMIGSSPYPGFLTRRANANKQPQKTNTKIKQQQPSFKDQAGQEANEARVGLCAVCQAKLQRLPGKECRARRDANHAAHERRVAHAASCGKGIQVQG
jgi:hypothetical protein